MHKAPAGVDRIAVAMKAAQTLQQQLHGEKETIKFVMDLLLTRLPHDLSKNNMLKQNKRTTLLNC